MFHIGYAEREQARPKVKTKTKTKMHPHGRKAVGMRLINFRIELYLAFLSFFRNSATCVANLLRLGKRNK